MSSYVHMVRRMKDFQIISVNCCCTLIITIKLAISAEQDKALLISNFGRVLSVVCFLLGYSPASLV
jgi:hypothetical protein